MGNTYARYKTDKKAETEGVWFRGFADGIEICGRSVRSKAVREEQQRLNRLHRQAFVGNGNMYPPDINEEINANVAAVAATNWKNITDEDGAELPFTRDNALKLFGDLPEIRDLFLSLINQDESYRASAFKATVGNSSAPSAHGSASPETSQA